MAPIRGEVWKNFRKLSKTSAKCNRCGREVTTSGNTTNLWNHLLRSHNIRPAFAESASAESISSSGMEMEVSEENADDPRPVNVEVSNLQAAAIHNLT